MAVGSRSTNTMSEGLRALLGQLSDLKVLPDADLPFILNIEQQVVGKLREPIDRIQQMGLTAVPDGAGGIAGAPGAGGMQQQGPGGPPTMAGAMMQQGMPGASAGMPQVPGVMQARQQPNPDELRRVLAGVGGPA